MSNATATNAKPTPVKITATEVKDPHLLIGFDVSRADASAKDVIRAALETADASAKEAIRKSFMRGYMAYRLAGGNAPTVKSVTLAVESLARSKDARPEVEARAYSAAAAAWSRISAGDNQKRAPGAGRPEGKDKAPATDAPAKLSERVTEPVPVIVPTDSVKFATPAQAWNANADTLNAMRAGATKNPAGYTPEMIVALDTMLRTWNMVKPAN